MSVAAAIRKMIEAGLSVEHALMAAEIMEAEAPVVEVEAQPETAARSTNAERQARYRARKITQRYVTSVTNDESNVTRNACDVTGGGSSRAHVVNTFPEKEEKKEVSPPSEARHSDDVAAAFDAYCSKAAECGWPDCEKRTDQRCSAIAARLKDAGGLAGWVAALDRAGRASWLTGASPRGWLPNIDFFLQRKNFIKLIEGGYDDNPTRRLPQQSTTRRSGPDAMLAALAAELGGSDDRGLAYRRDPGSDYAGGPILDLEPLGAAHGMAGSR